MFLEEFRGLRLPAKLSQAELAERLEIGQDLVSRCELGGRRVDVLELQRWAEACNSSLTAFAKRLDARMRRNRNPELLKPPKKA
ncbi:MAG TPA: helix-turn-helix transcriptional regulator [Burkholderiaceae bacterium]|jgi:transcriptional regulator with XRE-family HTH domain